MEDKIFELMAKMYSEFTEKFNSMDNKIDSVNNDIIRLENKLVNNSKVLQFLQNLNSKTPEFQVFKFYKKIIS